MSFFRSMNRKQKRQFDKIGKKEQLEIFTHELNEKVKSERNKAVAQAFADGFLFHSNMMYEKYFKNWESSTPSERETIVTEFIEYIKKNNDKYLERHAKKESENE